MIQVRKLSPCSFTTQFSLEVQDSSIRSAAASQLGSQVVYSPSWAGPLLPVYIASGQLSAAEVFNVAIGLNLTRSSSYVQCLFVRPPNNY
jgi:hypothetical protein